MSSNYMVPASKIDLIRAALRGRLQVEAPFVSTRFRVWQTVRAIIAIVLGRRTEHVSLFSGFVVGDFDHQDYGDGFEDWLELIVDSESLHYTVDVNVSNLDFGDDFSHYWYEEVNMLSDKEEAPASAVPMAAEPFGSLHDEDDYWGV